MAHSAILRLPYEILHSIFYDVFGLASDGASTMSSLLAPYPLHRCEKPDILPYLFLCKRLLPLIEECLYTRVFVPANQLELFFQCATFTGGTLQRGRFTQTLSIYEYGGKRIYDSQLVAACPRLCQLRVDGPSAPVFYDGLTLSVRSLYMGTAYLQWDHLKTIEQSFPALQELQIAGWTGRLQSNHSQVFPIRFPALHHLHLCANFYSAIHPLNLDLPSLTVLSLEVSRANYRPLEEFVFVYGKGIHTLDLRDRIPKGGPHAILFPALLLRHCLQATTVILSYPITDTLQYYPPSRNMIIDPTIIISNLVQLILTGFHEHSDPRHLDDCARHFTRERYPKLMYITATFSPWCNPAAMKQFLCASRGLFSDFNVQATYEHNLQSVDVYQAIA